MVKLAQVTGYQLAGGGLEGTLEGMEKDASGVMTPMVGSTQVTESTLAGR
jgi:hypothetical protein